MNEIVKQAIAFVFKRSGKQQLKESELYLTVSMDLQWCSPNTAKEFISRLLSHGILKKEGEFISPSFDIQKTMIPLDFHPTEQDFIIEEDSVATSMQGDTMIDTLIGRLAEETSLGKEEIYREMLSVAEQKQLHTASALALLARFYNVDVTDMIQDLKDEVLKENTE